MRDIGDPRPGYFKTRLVKGGPWVAARIFRPCHCTINGPELHEWRDTCDRFPALHAEVGGEEANPLRVWINKEITKAEYEYLMGVKAWAEEKAPNMPEANPRAPVDVGQLPIPF